MRDLEAVLWDIESAGGKPHIMDVSLEFWKDLQASHHIRLASNGDVFYKYLQVNINPKQETDFILY